MASVVAWATIALLLLAACGAFGDDRGHAGEIPTEAAARDYLDRLIAMAETRDLGGFCELAGSLCKENAEAVGGAGAMPRTAPIIAGTRVIPSRTSGDAMMAGGRLYVLCGTDGLGKHYRTEVLVSTDYDGTLYAINGAYWSGGRLATSAKTGGLSGGAGIECPGTSGP
jgi:hypothetical protein